MKNMLISFTAVTGLTGLALTMGVDYSNSLIIGPAFIIVSGILFFISLRIKDGKDEIARNALFEKLSNADILSALEDVKKTLREMNDSANSYNTVLLGQIEKCNNSVLQLKDLLSEIPLNIKSTADKQLEQQNHLSEIIIDDVRNVLSEFSESQLRISEDETKNVKKSMESVKNTIRELIMTMEQFSAQNAETVNESVSGYKMFETLINKALEQMTSISDQDYDLLKELIK